MQNIQVEPSREGKHQRHVGVSNENEITKETKNKTTHLTHRSIFQVHGWDSGDKSMGLV